MATAEPLWIVMPRWDEHQHRDMARSSVPPWIKTYTKLMGDEAYLDLTAAERGILHGLWLEYASARRALRGDTATLSRRLGVRVTQKTLNRLNHAGFIMFSASKPASNIASKVASLEVEVEKNSLNGSHTKPVDNPPRRGSKRPDPLTRAQALVTKTGNLDAGLDYLAGLALSTHDREQLGAALEAGSRARIPVPESEGGSTP